MQKTFTRWEKKNIEGFRDGIFLLNYDDNDDEFEEAKQKGKEEKNVRNKNGFIDYDKLMKLIYLKERGISNELVKKLFCPKSGRFARNNKKAKK